MLFSAEKLLRPRQKSILQRCRMGWDEISNVIRVYFSKEVNLTLFCLRWTSIAMINGPSSFGRGR